MTHVQHLRTVQHMPRVTLSLSSEQIDALRKQYGEHCPLARAARLAMEGVLGVRKAEGPPCSQVPEPVRKPRRDPPGVKRGSDVPQPVKRERVDWDDSRPAPHVDVVDWKSWSTAQPSERRKRWPAPKGGAGLVEPPSSGKEG